MIFPGRFCEKPALRAFQIERQRFERKIRRTEVHLEATFVVDTQLSSYILRFSPEMSELMGPACGERDSSLVVRASPVLDMQVFCSILGSASEVEVGKRVVARKPLDESILEK